MRDKKFGKVNRKGGFTLIELLVVIVIVGILAAIAIPVYLGVQKNNGGGDTQAAQQSNDPRLGWVSVKNTGINITKICDGKNLLYSTGAVVAASPECL